MRTDHAAILTYVEPVSAVVFAALFLGESLTAATVIGGALVVTGGIVVARLEAREGLETLPIEMTTADDEPADGEPANDEPSDRDPGAYTR